jgi:predicted RNase H-like HicB family nuclease
MNKYLIIIEKTKTGYSAYSPDLPGCVSVGKTISETEYNMKEAIEFHIEGMIEEGYEVPKPTIRHAEFINIHKTNSKKKELTLV